MTTLEAANALSKAAKEVGRSFDQLNKTFSKLLKTNKMKTTSEILKHVGSKGNLNVNKQKAEEAIRYAQLDAWNAAIDEAAKLVEGKWWIKATTVLTKNSILKLKEKIQF